MDKKIKKEKKRQREHEASMGELLDDETSLLTVEEIVRNLQAVLRKREQRFPHYRDRFLSDVDESLEHDIYGDYSYIATTDSQTENENESDATGNPSYHNGEQKAQNENSVAPAPPTRQPPRIQGTRTPISTNSPVLQSSHQHPQQQQQPQVQHSYLSNQYEAEMSKLMADNQVLQNENSQLRSILESQSNDQLGSVQVQLLQNEIQNLKQENQTVKNELFLEREKIKNYQRENEKWEQAKRQNEMHVKTIDSQALEINSYKADNFKLKQLIDTLSKKLDQDKDTDAEEQAAEIRNLKGDNESLNIENANLRKEIESLNRRLDVRRLGESQDFDLPSAPNHGHTGSSAGNSDQTGSSGYAVSIAKRIKPSLDNNSHLFDDCASSLAELPEPETQRELEEMHSTPTREWKAEHVITFFKHYLKMPDNIVEKASQHIKSGKVLLELKESGFKKYLGLIDEIQLKLLTVHLLVINGDPDMPQDYKKYPQLLKMDSTWVADEFLPHLGLPELLSNSFRSQRVDMLVLLTLSEKEIAALCSRTPSCPAPKIPARSIHLGIRLLRDLEFKKKDFRRRILGCEASGDLLVWSNQMLIKWLTSKELAFEPSKADHLKYSGINGAFLVYSTNFNATELARAIGLTTDERDPQFSHLQEQFRKLVEGPREQIRLAKKERDRLKKENKGQANTISVTEGQRIINENNNSGKRSLSNSLSRAASRLIRGSSSRGSSRGSSRETSQDRRSVASAGAMTRESVASTGTNISNTLSTQIRWS